MSEQAVTDQERQILTELVMHELHRLQPILGHSDTTRVMPLHELLRKISGVDKRIIVQENNRG